jgi:glycine cleavage system aminomethyltransferase T
MLFKDDAVARKEHNALRQNVGWYRWTHDLVEFSGSGAGQLLDYLCVNSIAKAGVGRSKYTTMLDEKGKIIDDVIVTRINENDYWVSTLYAPKLILRLAALKGDLDVQYQELTDQIDMYSIQGPNSLKMMNDLVDNSLDGLKHFTMEDTTISEIPVKIHRGGFTGELGYEVYCKLADSKAVAAVIREIGDKFGAVEPTTLEVYVRSVPMEKGFALRQDLYGLTPYECGLDWSVDLSKDFVGKEALIRAQEEGLKNRLVGLAFEAESYEDISQGEAVKRYGVQVGIVRAAIYGYTIDKNIGFAIVDAKVPFGARVTVGCNDSPAIVTEKKWL